jgi:hypothetical protein
VSSSQVIDLLSTLEQPEREHWLVMNGRSAQSTASWSTMVREVFSRSLYYTGSVGSLKGAHGRQLRCIRDRECSRTAATCRYILWSCVLGARVCCHHTWILRSMHLCCAGEAWQLLDGVVTKRSTMLGLLEVHGVALAAIQIAQRL